MELVKCFARNKKPILLLTLDGDEVENNNNINNNNDNKRTQDQINWNDKKELDKCFISNNFYYQKQKKKRLFICLLKI